MEGVERGGKERENRGDGCDGGGMLEELGSERMDAGENECGRGMDSGEDDYGGSQMSEGPECWREGILDSRVFRG